MNAIMINSKSIRFDYTAAGAITAAAKAVGYHESDCVYVVEFDNFIYKVINFYSSPNKQIISAARYMVNANGYADLFSSQVLYAKEVDANNYQEALNNAKNSIETDVQSTLKRMEDEFCRFYDMIRVMNLGGHINWSKILPYEGNWSNRRYIFELESGHCVSILMIPGVPWEDVFTAAFQIAYEYVLKVQEEELIPWLKITPPREPNLNIGGWIEEYY